MSNIVHDDAYYAMASSAVASMSETERMKFFRGGWAGFAGKTRRARGNVALERAVMAGTVQVKRPMSGGIHPVPGLR